MNHFELSNGLDAVVYENVPSPYRKALGILCITLIICDKHLLFDILFGTFCLKGIRIIWP